MKKLLSLLAILGLAGFVIAPIYAQEEAVILDEEPIVAEAEDVVAEDVVAEDVAAEEVAIDDGLATEEAALEADDAIYYEDDENLEDFDFNSIFEDEEVKNALDEAGLTNEEAAWLLGLLLGLGALMIPLAIISFILWILRIIALWKAFQRAWQWGWEAIVPIYCSYIKYKLAGMKNWFWYGLLIAVIFWIIAAFIPDQQKLLTDIATAIVWIIYVVVKFKFARKYGWGVFASILYVIFNPICVLILGFGNYKYEGKEETIVEA